MTHLRRLNTFLNNHWLGDLIGVASLFATGWLGLIIIGVLQ